MKKQEYLDAVCKFCCGRNTCCVGTDHFCPCKTYIYCNECWNESAKEQRKLDIEKACEWLRKQNITRGRYDFINALRKAMEE